MSKSEGETVWMKKRRQRREGSCERGIVGCRKRKGNEGRKEGGVDFRRRGKEEEGGMNGCRKGKGEDRWV